MLKKPPIPPDLNEPIPLKRTIALIFGGLLALAGYILLFPPAFNTNDDPMMMAVVSGQLYGSSDAALIFIHHWLGNALIGLYRAAPWLNGYVAAMYVGLLSGIGTSSYFALRAGRYSGFALVVVGLAIYLSFLPLLLQPQYTNVAFTLGLAGLTALSIPGKLPLARKLLFSGLLLLASLLRHPAIWGLALLAGPMLLFQAWPSRQWERLGWLVFILMAVGIIRLADNHYYRTQRRNPEVFSHQRDIDILVNGPHTQPDTTHAGEAATLQLLKNWFWVDGVRMSPANLAQMAQDRYQTRSLAEGVAGMLIVFNSHKKTLLALLFLFVLAGNLKSPALGLLFLSLIGICLALSTAARLPDRVFLPLLSAFAFLRLAFIPLRPWASKPVSSLLIVLILLLQGLDIRAAIRENQQLRTDHQSAQAWVNAHPAGKIVVRGSAFPYEGGLSLYNHSPEAVGKLFPAGWLLGAPAYEAYRNRYWQGRDIWQQICAQGLICIDPPVIALSRYACIYYDVSLAFDPIAAPIRKGKKSIPVYWVCAE